MRSIPRHLPRWPAPLVLLVSVVLAAGGTAAAGLAHASPGAHSSATVRVAHLLAPRVATVKRHDGGIAVLLPSTLPLDAPDFTDSSAKPGAYSLEIDGAPNCDQANACLFADFLAQRGGTLFGTPVTLAHGLRGAWANIRCGASCAPAEIDWIEHGVAYTIQANVTASGSSAVKALFVAAANQAIAAGPR